MIEDYDVVVNFLEIAEEISDEGLKMVSKFSQLESLNSAGVNASNVFSAELMKLKILEKFRVDGGVIPKINFIDHPALKRIRFSQVQSDKIEVKALPQLRHFDFYQGEFSKMIFNQLPKFYTCLLSSVRPERVLSIELTELPQLHTFTLKSPRGSNEVPAKPLALGDFIAQFHSIQRLHVLRLSNVLDTDEGLLKLRHLIHLRQRDIYGPNVTDEGRTQLRKAIEAHRIATWGNKSP